MVNSSTPRRSQSACERQATASMSTTRTNAFRKKSRCSKGARCRTCSSSARTRRLPARSTCVRARAINRRCRSTHLSLASLTTPQRETDDAMERSTFMVDRRGLTMQPSALDNVVNIITIAGLAAFTVSGVIVAKRKDMDAFGCMSVAFVTALGGGTLRDVLLGRYPLFWIAHEWYAIGVFIFAAILFYSSRFIALRERAILIPDALGLGLFSVTGATYALEAHTSFIVASILGVITGVFGGVLRDVICNEIPTVF